MPSLYQGYTIMAVLYYGILFGFIFEIKNILSFISKSKIVIFILDFIFTLIGGFIFYISLFVANLGIFRLILLIVYLLGFILEQKSVGFFLAKFLNKLYNELINKKSMEKNCDKNFQKKCS